MKPTKETTLKTGAIAKLLGVTGVTVRHYTEQFSSFLSPGATAKPDRRFSAEDVQVLKMAFSLLRDGFTYEQVRQQLNERPLEGEVFEGEPEPAVGAAPGEQPSAIQPLEFFTQFVEQLRQEHLATIQAKDETIEQLKNDKARLQAEIDYMRLPWFVRWFRKP